MFFQEVAKKIGMANGDYVFFTFNLNRQQDKDWDVDSANPQIPATSHPTDHDVGAQVIILNFPSPYSFVSADLPELKAKVIATARQNYNFTYPKGIVSDLSS